jgi:hypothetical protein
MQKVPIWSHSHLYPTSARWFRTTWEKNDKGMNWGRVIMAGMVVKARNNQHPWQFWRWKTIENTKQMNIGIKIKIKKSIQRLRDQNVTIALQEKTSHTPLGLAKLKHSMHTEIPCICSASAFPTKQV